jgi:hypothetical protein
MLAKSTGADLPERSSGARRLYAKFAISSPLIQTKNILRYSVESASVYLFMHLIPLAPMHLLHMHHHLILPRKPTIPSALTATTVAHRTPEHCLLGCMSSVVVAVEVGPAAKGFSAASGKGAAEDEDARVGCWMHGADAGSGGRG